MIGEIRALGAVIALFLSLTSVRADADIDDAEAIALELSGELLAPAALVQQVQSHLDLIRPLNYLMDSVTVAMDWDPGGLFVGLTPEAFHEFLAGTYTGFDSLNAEYGPVAMYTLNLIDAVVMNFEANYHAEVLASYYELVPGAEYAEPQYNSWAGLHHDITADSLGTYTFEYAWACEFVCLRMYSWTYQVTESGDVVLLDAGGDYPTGVLDGGVRGRAGLTIEACPNPSAGDTQAVFSTPTPGPIKLSVFDVGGRLVRVLATENVSPGRHVRVWDGRGSDGRFVAAGMYYLLITAGDHKNAAARVVIMR